jgi:hypothetical protein
MRGRRLASVCVIGLLVTLLSPSAARASVLPNGTYRVHLVSGDPSQVNGVFRVNMEGVLVVSGTPTWRPAGSRARPGSRSPTAA